MVSIAIREGNSDSTPDVVNCCSIDLLDPVPFSKLNLHYREEMKGTLSPPATINLILKALEKNGSCCRSHPKRFFFFPPFLGVIKRCFSWLMILWFRNGKSILLHRRQLRLITMLFEFERQFSGQLRITGTNYEPSEAALIRGTGTTSRRKTNSQLVRGVYFPKSPAGLGGTNVWWLRGTGCILEKDLLCSTSPWSWICVCMRVCVCLGAGTAHF